jgi:hypothetical protein
MLEISAGPVTWTARRTKPQTVFQGIFNWNIVAHAQVSALPGGKPRFENIAVKGGCCTAFFSFETTEINT